MSTSIQTRPTSVSILGWAFIILGAGNLLICTTYLLLEWLNITGAASTINFSDITMTAAGIGILRRSKIWMHLTIAACWSVFIIAPLMAVASIFAPSRIHFNMNILGIRAQATGDFALITLAAIFMTASFYAIYRIISSKESREYFSATAA